jgi:hypothetical protein
MALIRRLSEQGVSLHTEPALTNGLHPLRGALLSIVGGDFPTFVWKPRRGQDGLSDPGFIQLHLNEDISHAHILYLSPALDDDLYQEKAWFSLLDQAVIAVGSRGIHSVVVEVQELGLALPVLRRAGFAVYTRQDVYSLSAQTLLDTAVSYPFILTERQDIDEWDIQHLYTNIVPRLVQVVEPDPPLTSGGWVWREDGELMAYIHLNHGSMATWGQLFIHPNADHQVEGVLTAVWQQLPQKESHPLYICVRRYQSWLQQPLLRAGFTHWGSQAVMVRHTTQKLTKPLSDLEKILETTGLPVSTPITRGHKISGNH